MHMKSTRLLNFFRRTFSTFLDKKAIHCKEAALYVHWPFCAKLCPYCDFNKFVRRNEDVDVMIRSLQKELQYFIKTFNIEKIKTVYFGGGTPSLAPSYLVSSLLQTITENSKLADSAEITLEVNPTNTERKKLSAFKENGINRVSIGVQALNNDDLKVLGRQHSVEQAMSCYEESTSLFDGRVSIDLMFGRPRQTLAQWQDELDQILALNCNHVSLYQLTMKKHTPMERQHRKGLLHLPSEECLADMYEETVQNLKAHGLERYEVSNFALKGHESKHNLCYWNGDDYIGIGPGAHGRLSSATLNNKDDNYIRHAFIQTIIPKQWVKKVNQIGHGIEDYRTLPPQENAEEMILLGLRSINGINAERFEALTGISLDVFQTRTSINDLIKSDYLIIDDRSIRATEKGFAFLDSITREVIFSLDD